MTRPGSLFRAPAVAGVFVCLLLALTGCATATVNLFDTCLQNYFWNYDNNGLKLLQLRFYPASAPGGSP